MAANQLKNSGFSFFNIGTGIRTTVKELLSNLEQNLDFKIEIQFSRSTPGDQFGIFADISNAKKELKWSPSIKFEEGIKAMVNWASNRE